MPGEVFLLGERKFISLSYYVISSGRRFLLKVAHRRWRKRRTKDTIQMQMSNVWLCGGNKRRRRPRPRFQQDSDRGRLYLRRHNTAPGIPFVRSVWRTIDSEEMKARPPRSFVPVKRRPLVRRDWPPPNQSLPPLFPPPLPPLPFPITAVHLSTHNKVLLDNTIYTFSGFLTLLNMKELFMYGFFQTFPPKYPFYSRFSMLTTEFLNHIFYVFI